jgi:putative membrane protein
MLSNRKCRQLLLSSLSPLLVVATAIAQSAPGGAGSMQQPGSMQQQTMPGQQQSTSTMGLPSPNGTSPNPQVLDEQDFARKALQSDAAELQLSQLAQEKSQSDDVKQYGNRIAQDDTQLREKLLKPVATQLGIKEPDKLSKKDKELVAKLESLSGPQFDEEYIKAMAKDHRQDLKDYKSEAQVAPDPNVRTVAEQGSKLISQHLELIQQIAQNHNVALDSK